MAPKYGRRPDGWARDPWHDDRDAQALGYESTTAFRKAYGGRRGRSSSQSIGKPRAGEQLVSREQQEWSDVYTTQGPQTVIATGPREIRALARHEHDVGAVGRHELEEATFRRRWRGRRVGGYELESDPERVRATLRAEGPGPTQRYRRIEFTGVPT